MTAPGTSQNYPLWHGVEDAGPVCSAPPQHLPARQASSPWPCTCEAGVGQLMASRTDSHHRPEASRGQLMAQLHPRARAVRGYKPRVCPPAQPAGRKGSKTHQGHQVRAHSGTQGHLPVEHQDLSHPSGKHTEPIPASRTDSRKFCHCLQYRLTQPTTKINQLSGIQEQSYFSTGWCVGVPEAEQESLIPARPRSSAQTTACTTVRVELQVGKATRVDNSCSLS